MAKEAHFYEIDGGPSGSWWEARLIDGPWEGGCTFRSREAAFFAAHDFTLQGWTVSLSTVDLYYAAEEAGTI